MNQVMIHILSQIDITVSQPLYATVFVPYYCYLSVYISPYRHARNNFSFSYSSSLLYDVSGPSFVFTTKSYFYFAVILFRVSLAERYCLAPLHPVHIESTTAD